MKRSFCLLLFIAGFIFSYRAQAQPKRIITLNGALTETVDALGLGKSIVAVDVTSTYPAYVNTLPKVSKNRSVSAEGLISFSPDVVLAPDGSISKEIESQINAAGIKLVRIKQFFTIDGTYQFIKDVAAAVNATAKGDVLIKQTKDKVTKALTSVKQQPKNTKVLFIYARGPGVMMVAGKNTHIDAIISLAGGKNAVSSFNDFKPYTTEALVEANPDVILMFDFGFSSLGGMESILKIPGMAQTNAGKNKRIVQMDADLLINFSTRLDQAILQLHSKI
ncbi:ABC transporter substrate-binding protein [Mucilaginibacter sp. HC2]|uniref:heme/hemin ABC transporter substrate-binding protein n=1 Tax=Mucilaginibacter inviolabilis TaxID=2714892 RepID=UPI00140883CB|nr:ABC transporter substrate-binding protein [Mucilaginibacter inviolabilis]NHA02746.1 ABC transporter substrate-binding protein [Mucilaginibacter inviolabilis]